jgi:altronate hydrolase
MKHEVLKVHPKDNVIVALKNLAQGESIFYDEIEYVLTENIPAKHKFTTTALQPGDEIYMYGVLVGKAQCYIEKASLISVENVKHASNKFGIGERKINWHKPNVSSYQQKTFLGYHRKDGSVGTANYWIIVPMVFCENRNVEVLRETLQDQLGYARPKKYDSLSTSLIQLYKTGATVEDILQADFIAGTSSQKNDRLFANVDGVKFLLHDGGCGGTRQDAQALCGLLAGYITHPNVAGATVLSLGCQHSQVSMLQEEINKRSKNFDKPLYIVEQQKIGLEKDVMAEAIRCTFAGIMQANENTRMSAPLSKLCIGLECGGSDGFSGISANPAVGYTSDLVVALGGSVILSEFPELCGVEQELSDRCVDINVAERFVELMTTYNNAAKNVGSGFDMNPSPGNIKDGLITDAIKSAGAAKKGGTSPVTDVLDYPEKVTKPGLNLLCTPGNDVESTTAEVGSGANIVLFTTGLGTPTGNPVAPVIKVSSNTALFNKMPDIIDINTGTIIDGEETIEQAGKRILDYIIDVASGNKTVAAVGHGQDDFILWKRGVSL